MFFEPTAKQRQQLKPAANYWWKLLKHPEILPLQYSRFHFHSLLIWQLFASSVGLNGQVTCLYARGVLALCHSVLMSSITLASRNNARRYSANISRCMYRSNRSLISFVVSVKEERPTLESHGGGGYGATPPSFTKLICFKTTNQYELIAHIWYECPHPSPLGRYPMFT